jgi:hypothetical protein
LKPDFCAQHEAQEHELNLIRDYESALIAKEAEVLSDDLNTNMELSFSLSRLGQNLRKTMRALNGEELPEGSGDEGDLAAVAAADWALERESELARLERENLELRRMLGVDMEMAPRVEQQRYVAVPDASRTSPVISVTQRGMLGGPRGEVGPYGTLKRRY